MARLTLTPSRKQRDYERDGIHMFMTPEHEALLMGEYVSELLKADRVALFELIFGCKPAIIDKNYRPRGE